MLANNFFLKLGLKH